MATDYKQQAQEEYDPQWNAKRIALINQTLGQKTNLSNQIGGINANYDNQEATANKTYDMQVGNQNLNNTAAKNNMSNSALGRGISRSSIIQSQLAEADQANNRVVNNINTDRTGTLNSIATNRTNDINSINNNITTLDNNLQNSLTDLDNNRQNEINTLARTLEDRAYARQLQERQMALSESNAAAEREYRNATLAAQNDERAWAKSKDNPEYQYKVAQINATLKKNGISSNDGEIPVDMGNTMNYLNTWADGKDDLGNPVDRATRSKILKWINDNAGHLTSNGVDVDKLYTWANKTFRYDKKDNGEWYKVDDDAK